MTTATCTPSLAPIPLSERERRPDRLGWLERSVRGIGVEAAGIHQLLQREQLI